MAKFRYYVKPRDIDGNLTEFVEITDDIDLQSIGKIPQKLENDEFDIGVFKFDSFGFRVRNDHGLYSDVGEENTIFKYKRDGCPFKLTWQRDEKVPLAGSAIAGSSFLGSETDVIYGLLNDDSSVLNTDTQQLNFQIFSMDSVFEKTETNYAEVALAYDYEDIIYAILNVSNITEVLTVDAGNISCGLNIAPDVKSVLENTTVKEALDTVLFQSNSVLYIIGTTIYVSPRDGGSVSQKTFYGLGSFDGIEDIVDIPRVYSGIKTTWNYWTWKDTTLVSQDNASVILNGVRKKEIEFDMVTNTTKRQQILDEFKDTFKDKKQEIDLVVDVNYENLNLSILNRVNVEYPPLYYSEFDLPLYDTESAIYDESLYPYSEVSFIISSSSNFKIIGKTIDTKNHLIIFNLKEQ